MKKVHTIAEYLEMYPKDIQDILNKILDIGKEIVPNAIVRISYQIPTIELDGKRFYFAAFKKHIGIYNVSKDTDLEPKLTEFRSSKDTVQFPLDKPIPFDLIKELMVLKFNN